MTVYAEYIDGLDEAAAIVVAGWRRRAEELAGVVTEATSYGMPALKYRGRPLVSVVATKAGFSIFPFSADAVAAVLPHLEGFAATKGGVKFTAERPLPVAAFDAMIAARKAEIDAALD